jgi:hypothetical protein
MFTKKELDLLSDMFIEKNVGCSYEDLRYYPKLDNYPKLDSSYDYDDETIITYKGIRALEELIKDVPFEDTPLRINYCETYSNIEVIISRWRLQIGK